MRRLAICLAVLPFSATAQATPELPDFDPSAFATSAPNAWYPLEREETRTFFGQTEDGETERSLMTVLGAGPLILDVETITVLDEAWEDDLLVERTLDYFAADSAGNVWYLGEDVTNFRYDDDGKLLSTDDESAWRAGVNGAVPGIVMPASLQIGDAFFQEHAPADDALDYAVVDAVDLTLETPAGIFQNVVRMFESSTIDTEAREYKFYAPGIGLIRVDEGLNPEMSDPELVFELQE